MAKKKIKLPFKVAYDAPVTLTFAFICIILFVLNSFILKGKLTELILSSPTSAKGNIPFELKNFLSYLRVIFYAFGGSNPVVLFSNIICILLLGPSIEDKYGSVIIGIMMAVAAIFSGVLNSCFRNISLQGASSIVFMMILLNAFMSFSKKKIPLSFVVVFALYITIQCLEKESASVMGMLINVAGGLCGSLFAFLASPKAKATRRVENASGLKGKAEVLAEFDDSNSPRFRKNKKEKDESKSHNDDEGDETVIGTLKF